MWSIGNGASTLSKFQSMKKINGANSPKNLTQAGQKGKKGILPSTKNVPAKLKIKAQTKGPVAMAVIPYSEIVKPEVYEGKFSLIPTPLTEKQIVAIIAPTPKNVIRTRDGRGGEKWDYVPGWWVKKKLNFVFGFAYDFEILGERVDGDFITVKGRLTIRNPKTGIQIAKKDDFGGAAIKYYKRTKTPLDIPNDFKAAQTDCLKRCAVQLGFCMDVYGKEESVAEGDNVVQDISPNIEVGESAQEIVGLWEEVSQIQRVLVELGHKTPGAQTEQIQRFAIKKGFQFDGWRMTHTQAKDLLATLLNYKHQKKQ